jgi:hypothetical protein
VPCLERTRQPRCPATSARHGREEPAAEQERTGAILHSPRRPRSRGTNPRLSREPDPGGARVGLPTGCDRAHGSNACDSAHFPYPRHSVNTPAHILAGAALFGRGSRGAMTAAVAGSLLPDLPMFGFYLWQKLVLSTPDRTIWSETYFDPGWQAFFDLFNSVPIAALGLGLAWFMRRPVAKAFFAAVLLHCALDLPLHYDDGHRHFFPLLSWRFESPVSYWDPRRLGHIGAGIELASVIASAAALSWHTEHRAWRIAFAVLSALYAAGYLMLYVFGGAARF